uniref:WD_REPEATS_REGION domain-containing protein n=1 Tax=Strongyloides papillosus TaxID=174720 RepID=A0A0N5BFJ1_STREA
MSEEEKISKNQLNPDDYEIVALDDIEKGDVDLAEVLKRNGHFDDHDENIEEADCEYIEDEESDTVVDEAIAHLVGHEKDVFSIDLLDGRYLVCGSEDDSASIWDLTKDLKKAAFVISSHKDSVTQVKFSASKRLLATADMSGTIIITDLQYQSTRCTLEELIDLEWIVWHPTADILFAGGGEGVVWMWLISKSGVAQSKCYLARGSTCTIGKLLPDGKKLLAGYEDGTARIWNLKDSTYIEMVFEEPITTCDVHSTSPLAAVGTEKGKVFLFNTESGKTLKILNFLKGDKQENEEENSIEDVKFHPIQTWLAVGVNNGQISLYDCTSGVPRFEFKGDEAPIVKTAWFTLSSGTVVLVAANIDGVIRIWEGKSGDLYKSISGGGAEIYDFVVDGDERSVKLFTACAEGVVRVFECD